MAAPARVRLYRGLDSALCVMPSFGAFGQVTPRPSFGAFGAVQIRTLSDPGVARTSGPLFVFGVNGLFWGAFFVRGIA